MIEFDVLNEVLDLISSDTRILMYVVIWILGWYLKEHTPLKNEHIPHALMFAGVVLGLGVLSVDVYGAVAGIVIVAFQLGAYDVVHGLKKRLNDPEGFKAFLGNKDRHKGGRG